MRLVVQTNAEIDRLASMTTTMDGFDGRTSVSFLHSFMPIHTYGISSFKYFAFRVLSHGGVLQVRIASYIELNKFKTRWGNAVREDECWVDPFYQPS